MQPCTSLQYHFMQKLLRRVHVCLAVTCRQTFWQNDRVILCATAVTIRWVKYRNKSQHQKIDLGEENSPAAPVGTRTRDLSIRSPGLYHLTIPTPMRHETARDERDYNFQAVGKVLRSIVRIMCRNSMCSQ